ncbi:thioredoxin-like protein CXXS1 [Phoenix dactylifera]|uniref:Thioredoxin-like protein CXXS1 n=1 Tax=Phoenix dactylifera TaxID=42345 RepID=A0A8B7BGU3_PHODC|nr:thioredoxin-like protein CXXS1 [Phoenix dactylifera]
MEEQQQATKFRVVKVDSEESWNHFITQANNQGSPVFVHFSASWCVPSLAMNSYFEELAMTYQDIVFLLVDVDEVKGVASKMEVKAMPTFVLMRNGEVVTRFVGANPEEMRKRIDAFAHSLLPTNMDE